MCSCAGTLLASPVAEETLIFLDENGEVVEEGFDLWDAEALQDGILASEAVKNGEALLVYDEESGEWKEVRYASIAHDSALEWSVWFGGIWAMVAPFLVPKAVATAGTIAKFVIVSSVAIGGATYVYTRALYSSKGL